MSDSFLIRCISILFGVLFLSSFIIFELNISINEVLLSFFTIIEGIVTTLTEPLQLLVVNPILRMISALGFDIEIYDHWRNIFMLLWLFNASNLRSLLNQKVKHQRYVRWVWAAVAALSSALMAGSLPLENEGVFWFAAGAVFLFKFGDGFILRFYSTQASSLHFYTISAISSFAVFALLTSIALGFFRIGNNSCNHLFWAPISLYFAWVSFSGIVVLMPKNFKKILVKRAAISFILFIITGLIYYNIFPNPLPYNFENFPDAVLLNAIVFVFGMGMAYMGWGFIFPDTKNTSYFENVISNYSSQTGIDILSVILGSFLVASVGYWLA